MADFAGANGMRKKFRVVGQPNIPGKLSYALATGVAKFGGDFVFPEMLHAKFLRSPYANARIRSIDMTDALAVNGLIDILTWEDEEVKSIKSFGESFGSVRPWLDEVADKEGQEVGVIVVAEDETACEEAIRLLKVEWDVHEFVIDILDGRKESAPVIRPQITEPVRFGGYGGVEYSAKKGNVNTTTMSTGDLSAGFAAAHHVLEFDLYMPAFASYMPNPSGSIAWWSDDFYGGEGKSLHIEGAVRERHAIAAMYDMPLDKTIQEGLFMGGKYCDWGLRKSQEITPLLSRRYGRPVRCINTREETFDQIMQERYMHLKVGYTDEGIITAVDDYSIADGGVRGSSSFGNVGDLFQGPFNTLRCQNIRQTMEIVDSNRSMMYVSGQHCPFNWDSATTAIYLISEVLDEDPVEIARRNLHGPTSKDDDESVPSFEACVEAGKALMEWTPHRARAKTLPDGRKHGASFRYQMCPRHSFTDYHSKLELRNGKIYMPTQGPLFGVFAVECNAMVVAEELGLKYDDVIIEFDYRENFTPVGGGADGTTASCWVTKECANILKEKILVSAVKEAGNSKPFSMGGMSDNPLKGHAADELDLIDGRVVLKAEPSIGVPLEYATSENLIATYDGRPPQALWVDGMGKRLDTMNTAWCEVAVDEDTGAIEILRFGVAIDPGKVIRPTSLESQIDQVMYFSQGCQLFEEFVYDKKTGVQLNNNMIDYRKPGILDVPPVDKVLLETRAGNAAYGSNGISHSLANTHLVIIAIHNAIGVWIAPPATPDKVLRALGRI